MRSATKALFLAGAAGLAAWGVSRARKASAALPVPPKFKVGDTVKDVISGYTGTIAKVTARPPYLYVVTADDQVSVGAATFGATEAELVLYQKVEPAVPVFHVGDHVQMISDIYKAGIVVAVLPPSYTYPYVVKDDRTGQSWAANGAELQLYVAPAPLPTKLTDQQLLQGLYWEWEYEYLHIADTLEWDPWTKANGYSDSTGKDPAGLSPLGRQVGDAYYRFYTKNGPPLALAALVWKPRRVLVAR